MRISDWSSDVCSSDLTTFCTLARVCVSDFVRIPPPAVWPVRKRQEFAGPRWWARLGLNQRPFRCERNAQIGRATSELQSLMRISYAVFCLKKKKTTTYNTTHSIK